MGFVHIAYNSQPTRRGENVRKSSASKKGLNRLHEHMRTTVNSMIIIVFISGFSAILRCGSYAHESLQFQVLA
jgi:hypothetical protein